MWPPALQQTLLPLYGGQNDLLFCLIHHARAVELGHKVLLLPQDGHRCSVGLYCMETGRGFYLAVHNELPYLLALTLGLQEATAFGAVLSGSRISST